MKWRSNYGACFAGILSKSGHLSAAAASLLDSCSAGASSFFRKFGPQSYCLDEAG